MMKQILLIEDDHSIIELLAEALSDHNYRVDVATDGQAGWDFVESSDYDLLLLDVLLPKVDGISLCRRLRSHGYGMPILMLTARDTRRDRLAGIEAGANDYLVKPYKLKELLARIRNLLPSAQASTMVL
ncbi:MAG: response regulator [Pseudanabaenales cyanobacterium]|nr:response regulator [Pseudanabaenales cyanobacterium]